MAKRDLPRGTPDFDASSLHGASSKAGIMGVDPIFDIGALGRAIKRLLAFFKH